MLLLPLLEELLEELPLASLPDLLLLPLLDGLDDGVALEEEPADGVADELEPGVDGEDPSAGVAAELDAGVEAEPEAGVESESEAGVEFD